ncbi:hypothetical protein C2G38_2068349 [Gigaspora rosea]|uniref:Peptidase S1 domain-containing protein n=1 Tax=Gigaspora rosea TaxID=44941 RepID=A0A397VVP7_9GLOM|nr:hypothetical protein C2G38_2068349 [Gigaspora rosea]
MSQIQLNLDEISLLAYKLVPKLLFIYTDMEINNNVIYIFEKNINNSEFINATKPLNPTIIYDEDQENPSVSQNLAQSRRDFDSRNLEVKVLGGDGLLNEDTGSRCSVGFWAKSFSREDFSIVTAGHCYASGEYSYYPWGSTNSSELIITGGAPVSNHNVHICKSGYTTHLTCGRVYGLNGIALGNESEVMLYNLIITDFVSDYGDSGGSAFSFVSPQDLHSVVVNGVFNKIFKELDERDRYYELYLGKWWVHKNTIYP